jgi:hypothetical protein
MKGWGWSALLAVLSLAACGGDDKKSATSCAADTECSGGVCLGQECFTTCTGQADCTGGKECEDKTVGERTEKVCVAAFAGCAEGPLGTWEASFTREVPGVEDECVTDGQVTQKVILEIVVGEGDVYVGSAATTNNPKGDGTCFDYTQEGFDVDYVDEAGVIHLLKKHEAQCNGQTMAWDMMYGLDVRQDATCLTLTGTAWNSPKDPCDAYSGKVESPIVFQKK